MSGRKQLNGIARNAAHQFSSSAEHFAFLSLTTGRNLISIDLMTGKITPDEFRIPRNLNLVEMVMANLHRSFSRFPGTIITSATLMVEFSSEWNGSLFIKSSKYTTVLKDIKGKEWKGAIESSPQLISD